jgi:hypothetical protein
MEGATKVAPYVLELVGHDFSRALNHSATKGAPYVLDSNERRIIASLAAAATR